MRWIAVLAAYSSTALMTAYPFPASLLTDTSMPDCPKHVKGIKCHGIALSCYCFASALVVVYSHDKQTSTRRTQHLSIHHYSAGGKADYEYPRLSVQYAHKPRHEP